MDLIQHRFKTADINLNRQPQEESRLILKEMLQIEIIEEFSSPWTSPILLVTKEGSTTLCVYFENIIVMRKDFNH